MSVLSFDRPKKVRSSKAHAEMFQSDTGIPGTYVQNMSEEDKHRWKAKHIKGKDPRVEIRKTVTGPQSYAQVLLIVRPPTLAFGTEPFVEMSANGKMLWTLTTWTELIMAVNEAFDLLKDA